MSERLECEVPRYYKNSATSYTYVHAYLPRRTGELTALSRRSSWIYTAAEWKETGRG